MDRNIEGKRFSFIRHSATVGTVAGAAAASACCWLPLVLVAFGLSAGGASVLFETARPYLLALAGVFAGGLTYSAFTDHRRTAPESKACDRRDRRQKPLAAFVSLIVVAGAAAFPDILSATAASNEKTIVPAAGEEAVLEFAVEGMTCAGCAVTLEHRLEKIAGVASAAVNYEQGIATLRIADSGRAPSGGVRAAVEDAAEDAGFPVNFVRSTNPANAPD